MCRLAAFPPGTTPETAHLIVSEMERGNDHGVGTVYLQDKTFVINKFPISYKEAVVQKKPLFDHMPHKGWTLAHVRFRTHGEQVYQNTHPIIRGDIAVVHNGVFNTSLMVRAALGKSVKWQGETDSEVGAYILDQVGPEEFYRVVPSGNGVWLALNRDGSLTGVKLSGDLEFFRNEDDTLILASEFPWKGGFKKSSKYFTLGHIKMAPDGHPLSFKLEKKESYTPMTSCGPYTRQDCSTMNDMRRQAHQPILTNSSKGSGVVLPHQDPIELWNWPDDDRMAEYLRGLA